eukprot:1155646-Pelagomonas_calceolata.AAC.3
MTATISDSSHVQSGTLSVSVGEDCSVTRGSPGYLCGILDSRCFVEGRRWHFLSPGMNSKVCWEEKMLSADWVQPRLKPVI